MSGVSMSVVAMEWQCAGLPRAVMEETVLETASDRGVSSHISTCASLRKGGSEEEATMGTEEGLPADWRDSDIGESCSDHDCATMEVYCVASHNRYSDSDSSSCEDEEDFVVFSDSSPCGIVFEEDDCRSTPVVSGDYLDESDWLDSDSEPDCGSAHDTVDFFDQFQPCHIPFAESYCKKPSSSAASGGETCVEERPAKTQGCGSKSSSPFHLHCTERDEPETPPPAGSKSVRFRSGSAMVQVHRMCTWDFASRAVRRGPWEKIARDRVRFTERIKGFEDEFRTVFSEDHRMAWRSAQNSRMHDPSSSW